MHKIELYRRIRESIRNAQMDMLTTKAKLGERVVCADTKGVVSILSAKTVLHRINCDSAKSSCAQRATRCQKKH